MVSTCACSADTPVALRPRLCRRFTDRNSRTTALPSDARSFSSCIRDKYLVYEHKSMDRATHQRLVDQLRLPPPSSPAFTIPADRYRDPAWLAREAALFRAPQIVAAASALAPGACLPVDLPGIAAIVARDHDGSLHAYSNACRHRATRLVDAPCATKAHVCPYHGWTYDLRGKLLHVPHAESFAGCEAGRDLHALRVTERHGLIWLGDGDVTDYLGGLDPELATLDLPPITLWRSARSTRRCNWKLVVEAFLDGYHIRSLHRDSIYRFF